MNKWLLLGILGLLFPLSFTQIFSQEDFDKSYAAIDSELRAWDNVRGGWLASSIKAQAAGQEIPDRTFPEDLTPSEMLALVPDQRIDKLRGIAKEESSSSKDLIQQEKWGRVNRYLNTPRCSPVMARSYGDPHLKSFDGASFSFQTVGEFVLVKSDDNSFEVQARQAARQSDFSLNSAVAVKAGGDRVAVYGNDRPDGRFSGIYVNGTAIDLRSDVYFLPHGGTVRQSGKNIEITAPSGEKVSVDSRRSGGMTFYNVAVQIFPCAQTSYDGLFGDANGNRNDDFNRRTSTGVVASRFGTDVMGGDLERERLAFIAKDLGNFWRVRQERSLFDYGIGENTMSYTDLSFPRVHRTVNDIPANRRGDARRRCEEQGIRGDDLNACIYDNAFLAIAPSPRPAIQDRTRGVVLGRVDREVPNVNPPVRPSGNTGREEPGTRPIGTGRTIDANPSASSNPGLEGMPGSGGALPRPVSPTNENNKTTSAEIKQNVERSSPSGRVIEESKTPNKTGASSTKPSSSTQETMPTNWRKKSAPQKPVQKPSMSTPRPTKPGRVAPKPASPSRTAPTRTAPSRPAPSRATPTPSAPSRPSPGKSTPTRSGRGGF